MALIYASNIQEKLSTFFSEVQFVR